MNDLGMTIRARVEEFVPLRHRVEQVIARDDGVTVRCEVTSAESVGCALRQLEVVEDGARQLSRKELFSRAERLCGRITYLLEPLRAIEVDENAPAILVRSREPKRKGALLSYYELLADGNRHTSLRRFTFDRSQRVRSAVEFTLTADQLELLVDDLVAVTRTKN